MFLRQSSSGTLYLGPCMDDTDGKTPETGLSLTVYVTKNGGTATARSSAGAISHDRDGYYRVPYDATDSGTLGLLRAFASPAGALPVWRDFVVLPANVYDSLINGTAYLNVNLVQILTAAVNVAVAQLGVNVVNAGGTAWGSGAITPGSIATGAIDADALATDAVAEMQSGLATSAAVVAVAAYIDTEVAAILAAVDTEIAAILAKVNNLPAAPAAVGSAMTLAADAVNASSLATSAVTEIQAGLSTLTAAQVNAEVVDALSVDTYAEPGAVPAATSSLKDKIAWLFTMARNKHVTSATQDRVRNDADTADVGTAALSDDGANFTRGKYS